MKINLKLFGIIALAVMIMFTAVFTASCKGPMGPMGPEGPEGPRGGSGSGGSGGSDGTDGQDGKDGINGSDLTWYIVSYETHGGSSIPNEKIVEGNITRPPTDNPQRAIDITDMEPGLYRSWAGGWLFKGWLLNGVRYDFNTPITSNITLTADWGQPGLVTEEEIGKNLDDTDFIEAALTYIGKEPRGYLLLLGDDYTVNSTLALKGVNTQLVVRGKVAERTITRGAGGNGMLFDVDNGARLTLAENVKLQGSQTATSPLVSVQNISYLTMEAGSKITGHKTSSVNGAVYLHAMSQFTMNGGEISDNESTAAPATSTVFAVAGVYMGLNTEFVMKGGKISGNKQTGASGTNRVGGVFCYTDSDITMNAGEITGNQGNQGGGMYVLRSTFTMNGGKISENTTTGTNGGGMYISDSTFTMNGGEISGNISNANAGGMFANNITFTMNGGKISGNTGNQGGGMFFGGSNGFFTMNGGEISGNTGNTNGGGVTISNNSNLWMNGGKISGNTSPNGGGVYTNAGATLTMNGGEISGNTSPSGNGVLVNSTSTNTSTFNLNGGKISGTGTSCVGLNAAAASNSIFNMTGGEIAAGTGIGVNVTNGGKFTLSGGAITSTNARGTVYVDDNDARNSITLREAGSLPSLTYANRDLPIYVASGWTGSIGNINLLYADATMFNVITAWRDKQVVQGASGYTLTASDIAKFGPGRFVTNENPPTFYGFDESPLLGRYYINDAGVLKQR